MIENIIVHDVRGREFVNGLRSASEQMKASVSKFNVFCDGKYWRSVDGWCRYNRDGNFECLYFGQDDIMHNGCPQEIGDLIIFRVGISDCYMSFPLDVSPFYLHEHVVVGFNSNREILTKEVKKYKVKFDSSEDKYVIYKSALKRFINKLKKQV